LQKQFSLIKLKAFHCYKTKNAFKSGQYFVFKVYNYLHRNKFIVSVLHVNLRSTQLSIELPVAKFLRHVGRESMFC